MSKLQPLDDLEMHEQLRLMYPEHIRSDDDAYFELSHCLGEVTIADGAAQMRAAVRRDVRA